MSFRLLLPLLVSIAALAPTLVPYPAALKRGTVCSFVPSPDGPPLFTVPWVKSVVRGAQAIVRVRVDRLWPNAPRAQNALDLDQIQAVVLEKLVGPAITDTLRLYGRILEHDVHPSDTLPYLHTGYSTMCYRADFRRGAEHLVLLWKREDSTWTTFGPVFAPSVIQVRGRDDPWIQWVMGVRTGRIP